MTVVYGTIGHLTESHFLGKYNMITTKLETVTPIDSHTHPIMQFAVISNVWIKLMTFRKKGDYIPGHEHIFDHGTLLSYGSVEVLIDEQSTIFTAPAVIFIEKYKIHKITALEENTVISCIHALRDGDNIEDIIDPSMIPNKQSPRTIIKDLHLKPVVLE